MLDPVPCGTCVKICDDTCRGLGTQGMADTVGKQDCFVDMESSHLLGC